MIPPASPIFMPTVIGSLVAPALLMGINPIKSDIWIERTETRNYKAPNGHIIYAEPTY
jgi:hypothetical protein